MHFSFQVLLHFFKDSCKALLIISYVKKRYIKWKIIIIITHGEQGCSIPVRDSDFFVPCSCHVCQ